MLVLSTSFAAIFFMIKFVVPMFADVFKRFGGKLPYLTALIVDFSDWLDNHTYILLFGILALVTLLDAYDFSFQPELDKRMIYDLASCRFIDQKSNIILMGKPGVGKTHLAHAIGLEAIKKGKRVLFVHTNEMMEKLYSSRADGSYNYAMQKYLKPDLLILDELGFKKMPQYGMDDFFEIIRHRYESGSLIVTTNRNFEDWGALFGDKVMASAIIDRIVHHAVIVKVTG